MTEIQHRPLALEIAKVALAYAKGSKIERRIDIHVEGARKRDYSWKAYDGLPADWINYRYRVAQPHREKL